MHEAEPLSQYYAKMMPFLVGEIASAPEYKGGKKKLEDIWGSSDEEEGNEDLQDEAQEDSSRFDVDNRFVLDSRFSEHREHVKSLDEMKWDSERDKRELEREQRMNQKESDRRGARYQDDNEQPEELEDITEQIRKERSNALDILASMHLHNPADTLREDQRHLDAIDEDGEEDYVKPDDTEVLWGKPIARFDPTLEQESDEEDDEEPDQMQTDIPDGEEAPEDLMETEDVDVPATAKEVVVDTSWARSTLGGATWSLFGESSAPISVDSARQQTSEIQPSPIPITSTIKSIVSAQELVNASKSSSQRYSDFACRQWGRT